VDDIRPSVRGNDLRSMTYAEIAAARGISALSAERLVRRRRWAKQPGNDGTVRVLIPADEARPASERNPGGRQAGHPPDILPTIREVVREVIRPLSEQLEAANRRADDERARADRERERADQAERRITELLADQRAASARRWWPWGRRA
jgi:hypothetical protein